MAKNFTRSTLVKPKVANRISANKKAPLWLWIFTLINLIIFVGFLVLINFQDRQQAKLNKQNQAIETNSQQPSSSIASDTQEKQREQKFTFYEKLQQQSSETTNRTENKSAATKPKKVFLLQVGAFKDFNEADARKAQLALMGFEPQMTENPDEDGSAVYRVRIGPFNGRRKLEKARHQLQDHRISSITISPPAG